MCLLGSAHIQSAFISGMLISFDRFSLAHGFLILAPPIPGWNTHATSCYASHLHPQAYSCSVYQFLTFCLWYPQKSFTHQDISMETKAKGTKRLRVSFSLVGVMRLHASRQLCSVAFSSCPSDKSHWKATPSPCQQGGKHGTQPLLAFLIGFGPQGSSSSSEARSLFKSKSKI